MKLVAKIFIILNDILLFIAAIALPIVALVVFIKNPSALGVGTTWEVFLLWLIIYELLVVISFGVLAISVENYRNLKRIADAIDGGSDDDTGTISGLAPLTIKRTADRKEPSLTSKA